MSNKLRIKLHRKTRSGNVKLQAIVVIERSEFITREESENIAIVLQRNIEISQSTGILIIPSTDHIKVKVYPIK